MKHSDSQDDWNLVTVLANVSEERQRQDEQWGVQHHSPAGWLAILGEEFGEVAKEVAEGLCGTKPYSESFDEDAYRAELVQVAAVAVAAIECLDRVRNG